MSTWQLRVRDPSGEFRKFQLNGSATLGRHQDSDIILRDPTLPTEVAVLHPAVGLVESGKISPFWIKVPPHSPAIKLADLSVREALLPVGIPFYVGETACSIESQQQEEEVLPSVPSGVRPWLTQSDEGIKTMWLSKKAAVTALSVYIAGETGTGKEIISHLIHAWSDRRSGPFIPLNCAALPISLVESELFGHVRGSFTGAVQNRPGALLQAHGGTLFLDEIGDLSMDIQVKLLRFLENGEIRPIGADRTARVDVRLVCATHHPLQRLVEEGKFRRDLFYRLASITIEIPSLRSRPNDIELLSRTFALQHGRVLSPQALCRLQAHTWPGNVRELQHAVERATSLSSTFSSVLSEECFDFLLTPNHIRQSPELELGSAVLSLHEMERVMLLKSLRICNGHRGKAAKLLGVARSTLFEMLKRHKVEGPRRKSASKTPLLVAAEPVSTCL